MFGGAKVTNTGIHTEHGGQLEMLMLMGAMVANAKLYKDYDRVVEDYERVVIIREGWPIWSVVGDC